MEGVCRNQEGKYFPKYGASARRLGDADSISIFYGKPTKRRENLPSGKNLFDYMDNKRHRFNFVRFWLDHRADFPNLFKIAMKRASHQNDEVLCETFFSHAGFLSCPLRSTTRSKHYSMLALTYHNVKKVYIDERWIVSEYLKRTKGKLWDDSLGHLELINFEMAKEAEDDRLEPPRPFTMADLDMPLLLTVVDDDESSDDSI